MPTVKHTISAADGWVEVAADGTDYLLENTSPSAVFLTQQAAAPAVDAPFHTILPWNGAIRIGTGAAYISTPDAEDIDVVVTT